MMLTRRALLASALLASTLSTGAAAEGRRRGPGALRVFDSRLPLSRAWLGSNTGDSIDVAHEHGQRWRQLRHSAPVGRIAGLARWSDYVQIRGVLEQKGKRLR